MRTICSTCYKNSGCTAFLYFVSEKFAMIVSLKDGALRKAFLQELWLCTSSSAEVPDTQRYMKKGVGPMIVQGLLKMIQKF